MQSSEILASSAVVDAIKDSTKVEMIDLEGRSYFTKKTFLPPEEAFALSLKAHTLSAIQMYLHADQAFGVEEPVLTHVISPTQVNLISPLQGRNSQRHTYLSVDCSDFNSFPFRLGVFHAPEDFIIGLLSKFTDQGDRAAVLKLVGSLRSENVKEANDDGYSQSVTTRKGVASVQQTDVPSIVELAPYRTFRSIEQPASKFLLRFRQTRDGLPEIALFEADGSSWKHEAIARIVEHLRPNLTELQVPIIF